MKGDSPPGPYAWKEGGTGRDTLKGVEERPGRQEGSKSVSPWNQGDDEESTGCEKSGKVEPGQCPRSQ